MAKLDELIARLEAATEGSRELDGEIFRAVNPGGDWHCFDGVWHRRDPNDCVAFDMPQPYTTSTDAALTILPEWASFELTQSAAGPPTFTRCTLWDWRRCATGFDPGNEWKAEGNRPLPINILIAALKARAQD